MLKTLTAVLFLLISCASAKHFPDSNDPLGKDTFSFREPTSNDISAKVTLWGTYYYLPQVSDGSGDFALRDMKSMELGPRLTQREWCETAMEGSVRVMDKSGIAKTYNYAGVTTDNLVDCKKVFKIDVSKTKFREAKGPYGDGLDDYILAPYRTLATDVTKIASGTVLYIPEARGAKITLTNGRIIIHDGYFFAGDKGGAIKENHIDVFIGTHQTAPFFPWIKSNQEKTFEAFIVSDKKIISDLTDLHSGI
ncbi:MAG: hypothetical protein H7281_01650 [Bacteriovorax sp.]|nr:hypothetical protein [Bacteriovorax sp.]